MQTDFPATNWTFPLLLTLSAVIPLSSIIPTWTITPQKHIQGIIYLLPYPRCCFSKVNITRVDSKAVGKKIASNMKGRIHFSEWHKAIKEMWKWTKDSENVVYEKNVSSLSCFKQNQVNQKSSGQTKLNYIWSEIKKRKTEKNLPL